MLNPAVAFTCTVLAIDGTPLETSPTEIVEVEPPLAFQFQPTYVLVAVFTVPSDPNVNPSVPKAVTPPDKVVSASVVSENKYFVTPRLESVRT